MFRIRRRSDGMFSKGGMDPSFSKTGKTWRTMGHVNSHLGQVRGNPYHDCEIIEYDMVEANVTSVSTAMSEIHQKKVDQEAARQRRREEFLKDQRRKQYEELRREFG